MKKVVRISKKVVNEFNLNITELMMTAKIYDFGFDKQGFESFYFDNDSSTLNFLKSLSISSSTPANRVGEEFIIG